MKLNTWKMKLSAAGILLVSTVAVLKAQYLITANPADRGDPRASFSNAAVVAEQDRLLSVGSRALFFGATGNGLDLTHSYFTFTNSHHTLAGVDEIGFGVQGQVLHTPMFNAVAINALLAKQWSDKFSVGMNLGFANRAFDTGSFILEALDDPLVQSPSKLIFPDLGVGLLAIPARNVAVGIGINHLTQPSYAFSDTVQDANLPRSVSAGVAFGFGNSLTSFRALMSVAYEEREVMPLFAVEGFRENLGSFMTGLGRETAFVDAKLRLLEGVALNLRYSYPLNELSTASSGSPEFGLIFNLDKNLSLYAMEWTEPRIPPKPAISLAHAFLVESAYDTLFITEKYVKRTFAPEIEPKHLADLPRAIFFAAEADSVLPLLPERIFLSEEELAKKPKIGAATLLRKIEEADRASGKYTVPSDSAGIIDVMKKNHTPAYMAAFRDFAQRIMHSNAQVKGNFVTPPDAKRAHLLLRFLSLYTNLSDSIKVTVEVDSSIENNRRYTVGPNAISPTDYHIALRTYDKAKAPGRGLLVNTPVDTFRFSLNMIETERWGPVQGVFIMKNADGQIVLEDSTIVGNSSSHNQILRRKVWDWKMKDGSYPPKGTYYYYIVWQSADGKIYRSPESKLHVERQRIGSEIRLSKTMPQVTPQTRIRTFIHMN